MNINKLEDINFISMTEALKLANAGFLHIGVDEYHLIACTEEAYKVMEKAYDEWVEQEEGSE